METTRDINKIPRNKFVKQDWRESTTAHFFFKEGGVKYYIDEVSNSLLTLRNSKTGETSYHLMKDMNTGRYKDTYYFSY